MQINPETKAANEFYSDTHAHLLSEGVPEPLATQGALVLLQDRLEGLGARSEEDQQTMVDLRDAFSTNRENE